MKTKKNIIRFKKNDEFTFKIRNYILKTKVSSRDNTSINFSITDFDLVDATWCKKDDYKGLIGKEISGYIVEEERGFEVAVLYEASIFYTRFASIRIGRTCFDCKMNEIELNNNPVHAF